MAFDLGFLLEVLLVFSALLFKHFDTFQIYMLVHGKHLQNVVLVYVPVVEEHGHDGQKQQRTYQQLYDQKDGEAMRH